MPKIKIQREDIPTTQEWLHILDLAGKLDFTRAYQLPPFQHWLVAIIALDWMFGKRIHEIVKLKRKDIWFEKGFLNVLFHVGKKKRRTAPIEWLPYQKTKTEKHRATPFLKAYLEEFDKNITDPDSYLFPSNTKPTIIKVKTSFYNREGEKTKKEYSYGHEGGHVSRQLAWQWLQKINVQLPKEKRIWWHLGRHAIGTKVARKTRDPFKVAKALDTTVKTALVYTQRVPEYEQTEEWTQETE